MTDAPIADSVRVGDTIYLAGQLARDRDKQPVASGDLIGQTEAVFDRMIDALSVHGASLKDVVKLVTYFAIPLNPEVAEEYWTVRRRYFGDHFPASTGVQVVALVDEHYLLEVEAIAVVR